MKTKLKYAVLLQLILMIGCGIIILSFLDKNGIGISVLMLLSTATFLYSNFFLLISLIILLRMKVGRFEGEKYIPLVYFFSLMPIAMIFLLVIFYFVLKQKTG